MKIKLLSTNATAPTRAHATDAGLDLYAAVRTIIRPGKWACVPTNIAISVPLSYYGQIASRSGLATRKGLVVHNGIGVIDSDYRGDVQVVLRNLSNVTQVVNIGDRIAQLLICPISLETVTVVDVLQDTARGLNGFGSTGGN
ncbi:MAG: dUTP diphosphatase [Waterburya sp.]